MELIKYRDAQMNTFTYFWVQGDRVISPYFSSEKQANEWLDTLKVE